MLSSRLERLALKPAEMMQVCSSPEITKHPRILQDTGTSGRQGLAVACVIASLLTPFCLSARTSWCKLLR